MVNLLLWWPTTPITTYARSKLIIAFFLRAKKLGQSNSEPMGLFVNKFGIKKYLMGGKIAKVLQSIAKKVHPDLSREELSCISSHLGRVLALVLLDKAGMSPAFMTS
jgi:hypothetical protein